jgi:hypothetical protein
MTMLTGNRTLLVGEARLVGHRSERIPQTRKRIRLASTRGTKQLLRRLTVVLNPLNRGKRVIDLAWCFWHNRHLRWPASALGP